MGLGESRVLRYQVGLDRTRTVGVDVLDTKRATFIVRSRRVVREVNEPVDLPESDSECEHVSVVLGLVGSRIGPIA